MPAVNEPTRTCIGCRQRSERSHLIRFVADGGRLRLGSGRPGRGAWICASNALACFDVATKAHQWSRALRAPIDPRSLASVRAQLAAGAEPAERSD